MRPDESEEIRRLREDLDAQRRKAEAERRQLDEQLRRVEKENHELRKKNHDLEQKNRSLERRLARLLGSPGVLALSDKTAEAAGVPSSKTYYRRPAPRNPDGSKRRPGGQPGHEGHARKRPIPNRPTLEITLEKCPTTGVRLPPPADWLERTITDLPAPTVDIYEECRARYHCLCGRRHVAESSFPPYQQWGPNLVAFVVHHRMLALSTQRVRVLLQESYGLPVSDGVILGMEAHAAALLGPRYAQIQEQVRSAAFVGADETGFRVAGDNGWLWTFVTMDAVLYEAADTRGASVPKRVLGGFNGVLGRDGWDPYDKVACKAHQLDPIHINRWLERAEHKADIEPRTLLSRAPAKKTRAGRPPAELLRFVDGVRGLLQEAIAFVESKPPPGPRRRARAYKTYRRRLKRLLGRPWKHADAVRISKELRARLDMVFTFVRCERVPWHNNAAENAIRQGVLHRKASGGRRTRAGADVLARLLSVYRTCQKTGENFSAAVRDVYAMARPRPPGVPSDAP